MKIFRLSICFIVIILTSSWCMSKPIKLGLEEDEIIGDAETRSAQDLFVEKIKKTIKSSLSLEQKNKWFVVEIISDRINHFELRIIGNFSNSDSIDIASSVFKLSHESNLKGIKICFYEQLIQKKIESGYMSEPSNKICEFMYSK